MLLCVELTHPLAQLLQMLPTVKLLVFAPPSDTHPKWMQSVCLVWGDTPTTRLSTFSREKFEWRLPTYTPGHFFQLNNQSNAVSGQKWLLVRDQSFDAVLQLRY